MLEDYIPILIQPYIKPFMKFNVGRLWINEECFEIEKKIFLKKMCPGW